MRMVSTLIANALRKELGWDLRLSGDGGSETIYKKGESGAAIVVRQLRNSVVKRLKEQKQKLKLVDLSFVQIDQSGSLAKEDKRKVDELIKNIEGPFIYVYPFNGGNNCKFPLPFQNVVDCMESLGFRVEWSCGRYYSDELLLIYQKQTICRLECVSLNGVEQFVYKEKTKIYCQDKGKLKYEVIRRVFESEANLVNFLKQVKRVYSKSEILTYFLKENASYFSGSECDFHGQEVVAVEGLRYWVEQSFLGDKKYGWMVVACDKDGVIVVEPMFCEWKQVSNAKRSMMIWLKSSVRFNRLQNHLIGEFSGK